MEKKRIPSTFKISDSNSSKNHTAAPITINTDPATIPTIVNLLNPSSTIISINMTWDIKAFLSLKTESRSRQITRCIPLHAFQLRYRSAKSIAPCRMHLQKKVHGGLRGDKWGLH